MGSLETYKNQELKRTAERKMEEVRRRLDVSLRDEANKRAAATGNGVGDDSLWRYAMSPRWAAVVWSMGVILLVL